MVLAAHTIIHHDSGGLLRKAASRRDGFLLSTGLVARPGIYLYKINGKIVRELVLREVLQKPVYALSFPGKALTISHNQSESGPHYTLDELGDGNVAGATGLSWWNADEDAQEVQVNIWTSEGRQAFASGATFLSPAYAARVQFYDQPQHHPEFGFYDAIQLERGPINHTTLTDDPRGGPRMSIKGDSAQLMQRADTNQTSTPFPSYNGFQGVHQPQQQQPQAQHIHYHGDMGGAGGQQQGGGSTMEQAMTALLQQGKANGEKLDKLIELMGGQASGQQQGDMGGAGGQQQQQGNDGNMPKGDAAQVTYFNERQDMLAIADSMNVAVDRNWTNPQIKRALVKAKHSFLTADASDATIKDLYAALASEFTQQTKGPSEGVRQRHQEQGRGIASGAHTRRSGDSKSAPIRFDELSE